MLDEWLGPKAAALEARGLTRRLRVRSPGERVIDLAGNDYLGLARDPRVIEAAVAAAREWGTGATASRLVTGTTALHTELESALAAYTGHETGLVFSSGYLANLGVVTALAGPDTLLVADDHVHASLVDASRLSRSRVEVVPHNDVAAVGKVLAERKERRAVVLVESVYSVLGDAAPLPELARVAEEYDALLLVDEAHGIGVTGGGRGSVAAAGLAGTERVVVTMTLSKALAGQGGVVLGPAILRDHLVNRARPFIFDTGLNPPACASALAALHVLQQEPGRVTTIHRTAARLTATTAPPFTPAPGPEPVPGPKPVPGSAPVPGPAPRPATTSRAERAPDRAVSPFTGPVVSVPMPGPLEAVRAAEACLDRGVRVGTFRPPSVPDGISRLRLTARAGLSEDELDHACSTLTTVLKEYR